MKYSPKYYEDFEHMYPEIASDFEKIAEDCHKAGPLDPKTWRLVKLGIAIGIGSEGDTQNHTLQALDEGITPGEIRHAVLQSITTAGFPRFIVASRWTEEIIAKNSRSK